MHPAGMQRQRPHSGVYPGVTEQAGFEGVARPALGSALGEQNVHVRLRSREAARLGVVDDEIQSPLAVTGIRRDVPAEEGARRAPVGLASPGALGEAGDEEDRERRGDGCGSSKPAEPSQL